MCLFIMCKQYSTRYLLKHLCVYPCMYLAHQRCGEDCFDGGAAGAAAAWRVDPLLLLPAVAEPHTDHLLLHVQLVGDHGDLLRGRFLVLLE